MTTNKKTLTHTEWIILILGATILFGVILRFFPGLQAGFPLNDGGMFLSMIRDLHVSHYALPAVTSYNSLDIPYAYPPFGFYFARLLSDLFNLTELTLLRWLPPTINTLTIFSFYALASLLLESRRRAAVAAIFYALTPGASAWFIMGGGLTRSFGSLFMLLSLSWVYRLFRDGGKIELALSILFCSLTVLSHPEVGIHTVAGCILLWLFYAQAHKLRATLYALIIMLATLFFSAPWWGNVLSDHGFYPFLSALNTGSYGTSIWRALFSDVIASQTVIPILVLVRVVGIIWGGWRRKYFLIAWVILPYFVEPRSAPSISFYPFCMLMALAITDAFPALVDYYSRQASSLPKLEFNQRRFLNTTLLIIMIYLFVESGLFGFKLINTSLTIADREAMIWIRNNTPAQSRFLPITGVQSPEIDPFVEWFPALTERRSQTTIQGFEWLLGPEFYERYRNLARVQACESVVCLAEWSARTGLDYQYIVIQKSGVDQGLLSSLDSENQYKVIYSTKEVLIYSLLEP
ncbi:MAG: hypothetical protein HY863_07280 [Chloroflexi bacterium]|nr:hypothetical protein [Chloroflexota bacterium]